ncbi:MAG TPA: hypothetical protein ENK83_07415 [Aliiroseovarius sp.]|nr:hypothetical protein [Aliiroseovarius sp.]
MIFGPRILIRGKLHLKTDLHLGGSDARIEASTDKQGNAITREVSPVVRDFSGKPMIPATSLKGVLRHALRSSAQDADGLLGSASDVAKQSGAVASLWLDHAVLERAGADLANLSESGSEGGVYQAKHVALDPATGTAADNKLFEREMVGAGAIFSFEAHYFGDGISALGPVFALLEGGLQFGRGTTKGLGRMVLPRESLTVLRFVADDMGVLGAQDAPDLGVSLLGAMDQATVPGPQQHQSVTLRLTAEGPFLSVVKIGRGRRNNEMQPLERDGGPALFPTSIAGALRSRARWLAGLDAARDGASPEGDSPNTRRDRATLLSAGTEVEQLFGVTGRRGKLTVREVHCTHPGTVVYFANNSIDRLTGAARDQALYGKRAYWQPEFKVTLDVEGDHSLFDRLLDDLKTNGIELGHGATTGFGWFTVEVPDDAD